MLNTAVSTSLWLLQSYTHVHKKHATLSSPCEQISGVELAPVQNHCGAFLSKMPHQMQLPDSLSSAWGARHQELSEAASALHVCVYQNWSLSVPEDARVAGQQHQQLLRAAAKLFLHQTTSSDRANHTGCHPSSICNYCAWFKQCQGKQCLQAVILDVCCGGDILSASSVSSSWHLRT